MNDPVDGARPAARDATQPPVRVLDNEAEHTVKNHLAIILGYCDLLLRDLPQGDPWHGDLLEIQRAAGAVLAILGGGERQ